ncbi:MAG: D-sedoheptulose 7-phosphate isomerase [Bacteriovoracaceae bacterium]|nr:D-sedoheptulose 7-phosphate isomerase [Bacteriovoracaceae bacterium]
MSHKFIHDHFEIARDVMDKFINDSKNFLLIEQSIACFAKSLKNGGKILSAGNGGSMCDSMHFVQELTGRFRKDRPAIAAMAMGDPAHLTCVSNDFGYDHVFSRYIESLGKKGDVFLAISTSGHSKNVLLACTAAKKQGMSIVALTGKDGGELKDMADFALVVPSLMTDHIQEIHIKIIHTFIEGIERELYPEHYSKS